jgi:hypothetical protein
MYTFRSSYCMLYVQKIAVQLHHEYGKTLGTIFLPKIMSWFRGDIGGKKKHCR